MSLERVLVYPFIYTTKATMYMRTEIREHTKCSSLQVPCAASPELTASRSPQAASGNGHMQGAWDFFWGYEEWAHARGMGLLGVSSRPQGLHEGLQEDPAGAPNSRTAWQSIISFFSINPKTPGFLETPVLPYRPRLFPRTCGFRGSSSSRYIYIYIYTYICVYTQVRLQSW